MIQSTAMSSGEGRGVCLGQMVTGGSLGMDCPDYLSKYHSKDLTLSLMWVPQSKSPDESCTVGSGLQLRSSP